MDSKPQKVITVEPYDGIVTVSFAGDIIASSRKALVLRETPYEPVLYVPFEDIYFEHLEKTATSTHCPYKGDASYWSVTGSGEGAADVMWAYEHPYEGVAKIARHGAFYPKKVTIDAGSANG